MQPDTIEKDLKIMKALTWVLSTNNKQDPAEVEDHVPRTSEVLSRLGQLFSTGSEEFGISPLSKLEVSSVSALHMCARRPCSSEAMQSELDATPQTFQKVVGLGNAGKYLEAIELSDKKKTLWSPIYYFNRHDTLRKFFQRQTYAELAPIGEAIEVCAEKVGTPLQALPVQQKNAAIAGMKVGAIVPITLWMPSGDGKVDYTFLFPPLSKFEDSDPSGQIYEQPKVFLASLRLGEYYAPTSKIKDPLDVVRRLLKDGKLGRPHSDAFDQYKVPASRGLFKLKEEEGTSYWGNPYRGWMPYLIRSEENIKALQIVESLITPSSERISTTLSHDVESADNVFKQALTCQESLEFRGSPFVKDFIVDPELEREAQMMALTIVGGTYE
jgi:hypothetical protein